MIKNNVHKTSALRHVVKDIQYFGLYNSSKDQGAYRLFADGLVGLVFYEADGPVSFNGEYCSQLFLYGQTVKPLEITYQSGFNIIVVYFQPYALQYLFGIDASELTDTCLDFDAINKQLRLDLIDARTTEGRIELILECLLQIEEAKTKKTDDRIVWATDKIIQDSGNISLSCLHKELHITERTFERQFLKAVGVTPATFSRICRFHSAIKGLQGNNFKSLTDIAYNFGYADQSHFIRHFKEFTTLTPSQYLARLNAANNE